MHRYKTGKTCKGWVDVSTLPDGTFFWANNGCWDGFVTTEDNQKVMYTGVSLTRPTEDYENRIVLSPKLYMLDIDIVKTEREHRLGEEAIQTMEWGFRELMKILAGNTKSQSDEFAQGMRILDAIREECGLLENIYEDKAPEECKDELNEER